MGCKTSSLTELKYMAFHYVTTCFKCIIIRRTEYSLLSKQSVMSVRKTAGLLSLNRLSGLGQQGTKQGLRTTTALRTREVLKWRQRCLTRNRTD